MAYLSSRRNPRFNAELSGSATISGTTKALTVPVSRLVYLLNPPTMRMVAVTKSGADGAFSFSNLRAGIEWVLLSTDHTGAYNAVAADRVTT